MATSASRRKRPVSAGFVVLLLLAAAWCSVIEPRWVARREIEHAVPRWQGPPGLKVAVASDWHFSKRPFMGVMTLSRARAIVGEINAARPDVILLPGDFIGDSDYLPDRAATPEEEIAAVLGELRAPLGVFAVLGNHDWWHDGPKFAAALRARGIQVLENEAVPIDAGLWVAGIGDHFTDHSKPREALAKVPARAQALVFMHDPASLLELPPVEGLVVAGHTHGGQVRIPFYGALYVPGAAPREWSYGWVDHGAHRMYVTSGLGVSILPLRFNIRPEWVLFRIGGAAG
jgi:predicted MPP superfamily phosphohydrolase